MNDWRLLKALVKQLRWLPLLRHCIRRSSSKSLYHSRGLLLCGCWAFHKRTVLCLRSSVNTSRHRYPRFKLYDFAHVPIRSSFACYLHFNALQLNTLHHLPLGVATVKWRQFYKYSINISVLTWCRDLRLLKEPNACFCPSFRCF